MQCCSEVSDIIYFCKIVSINSCSRPEANFTDVANRLKLTAKPRENVQLWAKSDSLSDIKSKPRDEAVLTVLRDKSSSSVNNRTTFATRHIGLAKTYNFEQNMLARLIM